MQLLGLANVPSVDASHVACELQTALQAALEEIREVKNVPDTSDLDACCTAVSGIVKALLRIGYVKEAETVGEEARHLISAVLEQDETPRLKPLEEILETLLLLGEAEDTLRRLQEISSLHGIPLNDEEQTSMLRLVCRRLAQDVGNYDGATQVAEQIRDTKERERALGNVCEALACSGHIARAVELAQEIGDDTPESSRSFVLFMICNAMCEKGQLQEALVMCRTKAPHELQSVLLTVATEFAKQDQTQRARELLEEA